IKTERWGMHRGEAKGAGDPESPYYRLFRANEAEADKLVERSKTQPADVASAGHKAMAAENPKLRYVVGRPAAGVIRLRRDLPARFSERMYFGTFQKRIQKASETPSRG